MSDDDTPRLVVVSNLFGDLNRGGAAITAETIRVARRHGASVVGISVVDDPSERSHSHTVRAFPNLQLTGPGLAVRPGPLAGLRRVAKSFYWLVRPSAANSDACRAIARADLVVSKGGYVFVDRANVGALLSMWSTTFPLIFARRVGVPTMAFPTSAGPHTHLGSRLLTRWLMSGMTAFFARDPLSATTARTVAPSAHVVETPDIVLGMEPPTDEEVLTECRRRNLVPGTFAVMTARLPRRGDREEVMKALVDTAVRLDADERIEKVVLVDQADDLEDTRNLAALLEGVVGCEVITESLSPAELVALYGGAIVTVACRLHCAIFSLVAGTPSLAVSIDPLKAEGVYASLSLPKDWVLSRERVSDLPATADRLLQVDLRQRRREILAAVAGCRADLDVLDVFVEKVLSHSKRPHARSPVTERP